MLQGVVLATAIILPLLVLCMVNSGEIQTLQNELKQEQAKRFELETEVTNLKEENKELKRKAINMTSKNTKLEDKCQGLENQLTKIGNCPEQLQKTSFEKDQCLKLKGHQQLEIVVLKERNKSLHNDLSNEQKMNMELKAKNRELDILYDAKESHLSEELINKARLEEQLRMIMLSLVIATVLVILFCCMFGRHGAAHGNEVVPF